MEYIREKLAVSEKPACRVINKTRSIQRSDFQRKPGEGIALRTDQSDEGVCVPFNIVAWKTVSGRLGVRSAFISPDLPRDEDVYFVTSDRVAWRETDSASSDGRMASSRSPENAWTYRKSGTS
jgi:hypothetical protein